MELRQQIDEALETLEALYFFTQGLKGEAGEHLQRVRAIYGLLLKQGHPKFLADVRKDVAAVREQYGALASDEFLRGILREARAAQGKGLVYIGKQRIVRDIFSRYENSVVRWPYAKLHSFVVYDPLVGFLNQLFELDGQLFHDAQFMLYKARQIQGDAKSQRDLLPGRHRVLHTLLRGVVSALFTFIEAYLNGIAFDCFQTHHDELDLDDHDFLGEWNSAKKQRKFVRFDDKVFGYPKLIAKLAGRQIDLSGFKPAHRIINDGKDIRDAITHPSAQYDPQLLTQKKLALLAGLRLPDMEALYANMCEYVKCVEEGIGNDPKQSAPWLFDEFGFSEAKNETI